MDKLKTFLKRVFCESLICGLLAALVKVFLGWAKPEVNFNLPLTIAAMVAWVVVFAVHDFWIKKEEEP